MKYKKYQINLNFWPLIKTLITQKMFVLWYVTSECMFHIKFKLKPSSTKEVNKIETTMKIGIYIYCCTKISFSFCFVFIFWQLVQTPIS